MSTAATPARQRAGGRAAKLAALPISVRKSRRRTCENMRSFAVRRHPDARLVYSTGGEVPPGAKDEGRRDATRADGSRIRIRLDRRASDRVVTVITGLPGSPAEVAALAKALKSACGTGGTVKDGAVELQGDHRDKVEAELRVRGLRSKRAGG